MAHGWFLPAWHVCQSSKQQQFSSQKYWWGVSLIWPPQLQQKNGQMKWVTHSDSETVFEDTPRAVKGILTSVGRGVHLHFNTLPPREEGRRHVASCSVKQKEFLVGFFFHDGEGLFYSSHRKSHVACTPKLLWNPTVTVCTLRYPCMIYISPHSLKSDMKCSFRTDLIWINTVCYVSVTCVKIFLHNFWAECCAGGEWHMTFKQIIKTREKLLLLLLKLRDEELKKNPLKSSKDQKKTQKKLLQALSQSPVRWWLVAVSTSTYSNCHEEDVVKESTSKTWQRWTQCLCPVCSSNPCQNDGLCRLITDTGEEVCNCRGGYSGPHCTLGKLQTPLAVCFYLWLLCSLGEWDR